MDMMLPNGLASLLAFASAAAAARALTSLTCACTRGGKDARMQGGWERKKNEKRVERKKRKKRGKVGEAKVPSRVGKRCGPRRRHYAVAERLWRRAPDMRAQTHARAHTHTHTRDALYFTLYSLSPAACARVRLM